jgi:lysophospholipase L1-like esterase
MKANRFLSFINRASKKGIGFGPGRISSICIVAILLLSTSLLLPQAIDAKGHWANHHWIGTWSTSPGGQDDRVFVDQTLRQIVHITVGGYWLRVRFSNSFGTSPLVIDAASIGIQDEGAKVFPGSLKTLTFGGASSITIPPGARVLSDPVNLAVPDQEDLAVSIYLFDETIASTTHNGAFQTSYVSSGDNTAVSDMIPDSETLHWYWLTGVEVLAHQNSHAVVTLGDSITDGNGSSVDANTRYPDWLARRLLSRYRGTKKIAVLNQGIGGNRILNDGNKLDDPNPDWDWILGVNALARLDRDVLTQSGVTHVILLEGINDIGFPDVPSFSLLPIDFRIPVTAEEIIAGYKQIIKRVHGMGLKILIGTLTPYKGASYWSEEGEDRRQTVNNWIRTSNVPDGVIDFADSVSDPDDPQKLNDAYNAGDNIHLNDGGYEAMADAVNLKLLKK